MRGGGDIATTIAPGLAGSVVVHVVVAVALALLVATPPPARVPESISVEFLTEQQFSALTGPPPAVLSVPSDSPAASDDRVEHGMIRASTLLAARALANPLSAQAREALPALAGAERMEQLCNLEAMEQVHAWREEFQPDRLVAYALGDARISGHVVEVEGGAIRSGHRWYEIRYRCALIAGRDLVESFEFRLGTAIPRQLWEGLNLPADY